MTTAAGFEPRTPGAEPYSAMSVLAFASDDEESVLDFEAAWTLTIRNIRRGMREPIPPEQVQELARSEDFRASAPRTAG